jgi:hypothetical protein
MSVLGPGYDYVNLGIRGYQDNRFCLLGVPKCDQFIFQDGSFGCITHHTGLSVSGALQVLSSSFCKCIWVIVSSSPCCPRPSCWGPRSQEGRHSSGFVCFNNTKLTWSLLSSCSQPTFKPKTKHVLENIQYTWRTQCNVVLSSLNHPLPLSSGRPMEGWVVATGFCSLTYYCFSSINKPTLTWRHPEESIVTSCCQTFPTCAYPVWRL